MPDFHMTDSLSIAVHAFPIHVLISVSVNETLLPGSFRELKFCVKMSLISVKGNLSNHFTVCKQICVTSFKNEVTCVTFT